MRRRGGTGRAHALRALQHSRGAAQQQQQTRHPAGMHRGVRGQAAQGRTAWTMPQLSLPQLRWLQLQLQLRARLPPPQPPPTTARARPATHVQPQQPQRHWQRRPQRWPQAQALQRQPHRPPPAGRGSACAAHLRAAQARRAAAACARRPRVARAAQAGTWAASTRSGVQSKSSSS